MNFTAYSVNRRKTHSIPKPKETFASTKVFQQTFQYPQPLMNYAKTNPTTPKLYINLLKSCKYFYSKKDLMIPLNNSSRYQIWKIISSKKEFTKQKLPFNVWFTESLSLASYVADYRDENSCFLNSAIRCDLIKLSIWGQNVTLKDFQFLTANGLEEFNSYCSPIMYTNDTVVPVEKIFENLRNIKHFRYVFDKETAKLVTSKTAENMSKSIDTSKLKIFYLMHLPSIFNFKKLKEFTDARAHPAIDVKLNYN